MPGAVIGIAALAGGLAAKGALATVLFSLGVSLLAGQAAQLFRRDPRTGADEGSKQGRTETINSPVAPLALPFGETRVGGSLTWWHAHGQNDNENRTVVITHSDEPVEGDFRLLLGSEEIAGVPNIRTGFPSGEFAGWDDNVPAPGDGEDGDYWRDTSRQTIYRRVARGNERGVWKTVGTYPFDFSFLGSPSGGSDGDFAEAGGGSQLWKRISGTWEKVSPLNEAEVIAGGLSASRLSPNYRVESFKPAEHSPYRRQVANDGSELWFLRWKHYDGTQTAADPRLLALENSTWPSTSVGNQKAYTVLTTRFHTGVFPRGHPPVGEVTVVMKGVKVYDPRIAPGGGAVTLHDGVTAATANQVVWTDNWALLVAHYLTWPAKGVTIPYSRIDMDELIASADVCDELVEVITGTPDWQASTAYGAGAKVKVNDGGTWRIYRTPNGGTTGTSAPSGTSRKIADGSVLWRYHADRYEKRYTLDGIVHSDDNFAKTLTEFEEAGAGHIFKFGANWVIWAGRHVATPAELEFGKDEIVPPLGIDPFAGMREAHNSVRGTFISPGDNYRPVTYPSVESATYIADDNGEQVWGEMKLPWVQSKYKAYRLAVIQLRIARLAGTGEVWLTPAAAQVGPLSVVKLSHNPFQWANKPFQVLGFSHEPPQRGPAPDHPFLMKLTVKGYDAGIWDNPGDHLDDDPAIELRTINTTDVQPPTNLQVVTVNKDAVSLAVDGSLLVDARVTWDAADDPYVKQYEVQWRLVGESEWASQLVNERTNNRILLTSLELLGVYDVRVRSISRFDQRLRSDEDWEDPWQAQVVFTPTASAKGLRAPPIDGTIGANQVPNQLAQLSNLHPNTASPPAGFGANNNQGAPGWRMIDPLHGSNGYFARFDTTSPNWPTKSLFQIQAGDPDLGVAFYNAETDNDIPVTPGDIMFAKIGRIQKRGASTGVADLVFAIDFVDEEGLVQATREIGRADGTLGSFQSIKGYLQVPRGTLNVIAARPVVTAIPGASGTFVGWNYTRVTLNKATLFPASRNKARPGITDTGSGNEDTNWFRVVGQRQDSLQAPPDASSFVVIVGALCQTTINNETVGGVNIRARLRRYEVITPANPPSVPEPIVDSAGAVNIYDNTIVAKIPAGQLLPFNVAFEVEDDGVAFPFDLLSTHGYIYRLEMRSENPDLTFDVLDSFLSVRDE